MTTSGETLRLATRGSDLALRQAATVQEALSSRRRSVDLVEVSTTGDELRDELIHRLGKTGAFVHSLDEQVLDGELDAAVHSMKDMPTERPSELVVAGVPERAAAVDVLVTPDGTTLDDLPEGATVGTSSLRRQSQLLAARPDLTVEPLRGNVDTRVKKLLAPTLQREHQERHEAEQERKGEAGEEDSDYEFPYEQGVEAWFDGLAELERRALERDTETAFDAIVLAKAGLDRAGLTHHVDTVELDPATFVPAPGHGRRKHACYGYQRPHRRPTDPRRDDCRADDSGGTGRWLCRTHRCLCDHGRRRRPHRRSRALTRRYRDDTGEP